MAELGSGGGSDYPGTLDTNNTLEVNAPNAGKTKARAEVPNDHAAALVAIQTELGTDPAGSTTDVKTRLAVSIAADGSLVNFPATTAMVFFQAAAPTGWTQDTDNDDKALRVVSGSGGGTGGTQGLSSPPSTAHTHATSAHTLIISEIAAHTHTVARDNTSGGASEADAGSGGAPLSDIITGSTGGGGSHAHGVTASDGPTAFAPQYIDVIVCTKD